MDIKDWIDAGYARWETLGKEINRLADFGLQKCIRDDEGKRYYITVYVYDRTRYPGYPWKDEKPEPYGFMPTVQFSTEAGPIYDLTINGTFTVQSAESDIARLWEHFGRPYYERYE